MITSHEPAARIEVPKVVSHPDVQRYIDDGFLAVPGLVGAELLEELKADLMKLARGGYPSKKLEATPGELSDEDVLRRILCIHQPHHISPIMKKHAADPRISGVSARSPPHTSLLGRQREVHADHGVRQTPWLSWAGLAPRRIYIPTRDRSLVGAWMPR